MHMTWTKWLPADTMLKTVIWALGLGVALSGLAPSLTAATACQSGNSSEPGQYCCCFDGRGSCCGAESRGGCCGAECCGQQNSEPAEPIAPSSSAPQKETQDISVLSLAHQSEVQDKIMASAERCCEPFGGQKNFSLQTQHVRLQA